MSRKKKNVVGTIVEIIFVLLCLALIVGVVVTLSRANETEKTTKFSVEYGDVVYTGIDNEITLPDSGDAVFVVKNAETYKIKVLPSFNSESNFSYKVGEDTYYYSQVDDLTLCFNIEQKNNTFTIHCDDADYSLSKVLTSYHNGVNAEVPEIPYRNYYTLVISSGTERIFLNFGKEGKITTANGITLNMTEINF